MRLYHKIYLVILFVGLITSCYHDIDDAYDPKHKIVEEQQENMNQPLPGVARIKVEREIADKLHHYLKKRSKITRTDILPTDIASVLNKLESLEIEPLFTLGGKYRQRQVDFGLDQWFRLTFNPTRNLNSDLELEQLKKIDGIEVVESVYPICFENSYSLNERLVDALNLRSEKIDLMIYNDEKLSKQWHYDACEASLIPEAGIGLYDAWKITSGDKDVIVAVLDKGVDFRHEDLASNMWINELELNGERGRDDDNNGYVDDIYGYNFARSSGSIEPMDHGTHVAGTIAAVNNNKIGVCGVAGGSGQNDGARIMSCQIGGTTAGFINTEDAFIYAADNGAVIASCSWYVVKASTALKEAIDYFNHYAGRENDSPMQGGVVFFAAGNDNRSNKVYPPAWDNTITIASVNAHNKRSYFSNFGDWVQLSAPGGGSEMFDRENVLSTLPDNNYGYMMGTSMACPHVSGVAALVIAKYKNEGITNEQLKSILYNSVTDLTTFEEDANLIGKGLVRADLALDAVENRDVEPMPFKLKDPKLQLKTYCEWEIKADKNGNIPTAYLIYTGRLPINQNKSYTTVYTTSEHKNGDMMKFELNPYSVNGNYEIGVLARNLWGKHVASNVVTVEWDNDYSAPQTVEKASVRYKENNYTLSWKQVKDENDGTAVAYNVVGRDLNNNLVLDTTVWIGHRQVGEQVQFNCELTVEPSQICFWINAIDCWNNWSKTSLSFTVDNSSATNDSENPIRLFPNPVRNIFTLSWSEGDYDQIIIYDQMGRVVYKQEILQKQEKRYECDISELRAGIYVVQVVGSQNKDSVKIIKT